VGTLRNDSTASLLLQKLLKSSDQGWLKHVLNCIRLPVYPRGRDIGMCHQVQFPEPMVMNKPLCFDQATVGQLDLSVRSTPDESLRFAAANLQLELS
jgi:hypothetical protein